MSFYSSAVSVPGRFRRGLASFTLSSGLAFSEVLSEEQIQRVCHEEGIAIQSSADDIYTLPVTLWAFLAQALHKEEQRSCRAAVDRVITSLTADGQAPCSGNTGAYCRARGRLPERLLRRLACETAEGCEQAAPRAWLWHGRHVKLVDGSTCSMPDTEENQQEFPQHGVQKEGLGFPIARLVVVVSLGTALVSGMAIGPYQGKETGETALLRQLLTGCFRRGEIVLADRCYCSYFMLALCLELGLDCVFRMHQQRGVDFRRGRRLGKHDHLVHWTRPARPDWMDQETYDRMPETLELREVQVRIDEPGCRTESLVVVTTLRNARKYTREDLAELYQQRWLAEIDLRAIKCNMGMDVLRCKSPWLVRREIWTCLLAYNLIRQTILEAALRGKVSPRGLSFTSALQKVAACLSARQHCDPATVQRVMAAHLDDMLRHRVGHRPNRVEPRAIKRRPKPHKLLMVPRAEARRQLLAGDESYH
jgi:hypothetical protein